MLTSLRYRKTSMIHFHRVSVEYPKTKTMALYNINLEVKKGEFLFLVGHSGAGKSTLLSLALKRLEPTSGAVYVAGQNLASLKGRRVALHRRNIGMVFQDHRLLDDMTVEENLAFILRVLGLDKNEWKKRIIRVLRTVGIAHKRRAYPYQLSVGEAQRVAIARAIIGRPPILLADEPTGNLDPENAVQVLEIFKAIHALGTTIVIATHSRDLVEAYPQRVVVLRSGQIVRDEKGGHYAL